MLEGLQVKHQQPSSSKGSSSKESRGKQAQRKCACTSSGSTCALRCS